MAAPALIHFDGAHWWPWFRAVLGAFALVTFIWYVFYQVKFAPQRRSEKALANA